MVKKPCILIVGMSNSIHVARWINMILDNDWDIHLFPCEDNGTLHPEIKGITVHHSFYSLKKNNVNSSKFEGICIPGKSELAELIAGGCRFSTKQIKKNWLRDRLVNVIKDIKPDIIHSMEFQKACYLTLEAKKVMKDFPYWIATNWGSDIYLFSRLKQHEEKIREVLLNCDFYTCECHRDLVLARRLGYKGNSPPIIPNAGGIKLEEIKPLRDQRKPSERYTIMVKGYQGVFGRALTALRAIERCADLLKEYEIIVYSADWSPEVVIYAELIAQSTGLRIKIIPSTTTWKGILRLHGNARTSIGLSISDGLCTSFLEAIAMGSFPIQSYTACVDEWIKNGETGIIVHPEEPREVEDAIRRALQDDILVDKAAESNWNTVVEKLDYYKIKTIVKDMYEKILNRKN